MFLSFLSKRSLSADTIGLSRAESMFLARADEINEGFRPMDRINAPVNQVVQSIANCKIIEKRVSGSSPSFDFKPLQESIFFDLLSPHRMPSATGFVDLMDRFRNSQASCGAGPSEFSERFPLAIFSAFLDALSAHP